MVGPRTVRPEHERRHADRGVVRAILLAAAITVVGVPILLGAWRAPSPMCTPNDNVWVEVDSTDSAPISASVRVWDHGGHLRVNESVLADPAREAPTVLAHLPSGRYVANVSVTGGGSAEYTFDHDSCGSGLHALAEGGEVSITEELV